MRSTVAISILISYFLVAVGCSSPRDESARVIFSESVKDSFEIYIDVPPDYDKENTSVVFYTDANLRIGREIRSQIYSRNNRRKLSNVIFVGVGHIGDYMKLRRRDFIPPIIQDSAVIYSDDRYFGHAENFYNFMTNELIPYVNERYPNNGRYAYIGHSLGGLFAFHCLMKPETVFKTHIALSPSLWINYNNFFVQEELFHQTNTTKLNTTLYHACGTLEWHNKILRGSRRMKDVLEKRKYPGLNYVYAEHEGKGHNNSVAVSLEYVFSEIDF